MAQGAVSVAMKRTVITGRILGLLVFIAAFFLPACREVATPGGDAPDVFLGSRCARMTLVNTFSHEIWHSKYFLAVLSGWINPLLLLYLVLLLFPKLFWPRRIVAGAIVAFIAGTWVLFAIIPLVPLIGHVLWIAGILLILAGEAMRRSERI
jgi:hypothetical protein